MGLNINTIVPAVEKAKNIATEQYVDTSVASIDVSSSVNSSINANNDTFAQKLGYANYNAMVAAASTGQTIITGGHVNTSLISAGAINAGMINTTGLIADNISANEIVGKILTSAVINGAAINGAVIKASYLDLDGELEVLTNYHITVEMYNANPSLYIDAVYLSGTNEYRIPSLSTIKESDRNINLTSINQTITSLVKAYNNSNSGHNNKCVKIRPTLNYNGVVLSLSLNYSKPLLDWGPYITDSYEVSLYCFEQLVGTFKIRHDEEMYDDGSHFINDSTSTLYVNGVVSNIGFTNNVYGMQFSITRDTSTIDTYNVVMTASNQLLTANYTGGDILRAVVVGLPKNVSYTPANNKRVSNAVFKTYASMTINNMI